MKKVVSVLLMVMLCMAQVAVAENFSVRGMLWGTAAEQVTEAEKEAPAKESRLETGYDAMLYTGRSVSNYNADVLYIFLEGELKACFYDFPADTPDGAFDYLRKALSSVYGDAAEADAAEIFGVLSQIGPGPYDEASIRDGSVWTFADGTKIYLFGYTGERFAIAYISPNYNTVNYNVLGL